MAQLTELTTEQGAVRIQAGEAVLSGILAVPQQAEGLVIFAHGAGSSRLSSRNLYVADLLQQASLGTLLMDLLTEDEESSHISVQSKLSFDIPLLARRMDAATDWAHSNKATRELKIAYFGASTGAAAALVAAARRPGDVAAIVSRGGRPDLARDWLSKVKAPTMLIVGGEDTAVLSLNRQAAGLLEVEKELVVIPGATHLFEEPGKLDEAARYAVSWFTRHLTDAEPSA